MIVSLFKHAVLNAAVYIMCTFYVVCAYINLERCQPLQKQSGLELCAYKMHFKTSSFWIHPYVINKCVRVVLKGKTYLHCVFC